MTFVMASNNGGKLREIREILSDMDIEVISQREAGCEVSAQETGTTFEENAYIKAIMATTLLGLPAIADDSGLCVDALDGAPGIYSARYGNGEAKTDMERMELLLKNMEDKTDRAGRFVSCVCCTFPNGDVITARGECEGTITREPRGENGFGYDPIFLPSGMTMTMAEMPEETKNRISHRAKSLEEFKKGLIDYYASDK